MKSNTLAQINHINQQFYQNFADSFSITRHRIQSGVGKILQSSPEKGNFLDIGCGNGNLAREWAARGFEGTYYGVDFSEGLIQAAKTMASELGPNQTVDFFQADITEEDWLEPLPEVAWDAIYCFAVLHHIAGVNQREMLCRQIRSLAGEDSSVWISVWQPLNSPRLSKRVYSWDQVNISPEDVDEGDVLMDWRAHNHQDGSHAFRYVHIFKEAELSSLATICGFYVAEQFYSDGKEGNLGLYQRWIAEK